MLTKKRFSMGNNDSIVNNIKINLQGDSKSSHKSLFIDQLYSNKGFLNNNNGSKNTHPLMFEAKKALSKLKILVKEKIGWGAQAEVHKCEIVGEKGEFATKMRTVF